MQTMFFGGRIELVETHTPFPFWGAIIWDVFLAKIDIQHSDNCAEATIHKKAKPALINIIDKDRDYSEIRKRTKLYNLKVCYVWNSMATHIHF